MKIRVNGKEAEADFDGMILATESCGTVTMVDKRVKLWYLDGMVLFEWFQLVEDKWYKQGDLKTPSESWVTVEDFV